MELTTSLWFLILFCPIWSATYFVGKRINYLVCFIYIYAFFCSLYEITEGSRSYLHLVKCTFALYCFWNFTVLISCLFLFDMLVTYLCDWVFCMFCRSGWCFLLIIYWSVLLWWCAINTCFQFCLYTHTYICLRLCVRVCTHFRKCFSVHVWGAHTRASPSFLPSHHSTMNPPMSCHHEQIDKSSLIKCLVDV